MSSAAQQKVLRAGVVVAGKYRIDEAIARGGFSVIYRATHIDMERPVAIKVLTLCDDIKPSWLERFTREARLASQLTHPHTVTVFDYGQDPQGFLYLVMEWVEGVSLYQHLTRYGPLSPAKVGRIAAQILESLEEAHQRKFLHRDLKPSNIMLTKDFQGRDIVKVLDFGIAKDLNVKPGSDAHITHRGAFVGTPRYASPEQLEQKAELGPASDIYSLGLLMWEALVGDPAVPSIKYGECIQYHTGPEPWRLPAALQCPPGFERILYKALAKPLAERYPDCATMRRDLRKWLRSQEARGATDSELLSAPGLSGERLLKPQKPALPAPLKPARPSSPPLLPTAQRGAAGAKRAPKLPKPKRPQLSEEVSVLAEPAAVEAAGEKAPVSAPRLPSIDEASPERAGFLAPKHIFIGAGILLVIALALFAFGRSSGGDDERPEPAQAQADLSAAESKSLDEESNNAAEEDEAETTYSADLIWAALQKSGWRRLGKVGRMEFDGVSQENGRLSREGRTVAVTIFMTQSAADAREYTGVLEPPAQAIRFGKNVVHISPGVADGSAEGVRAAVEILDRLKVIAEEQQAE